MAADKIITHFIAGYPSLSASLAAARALIAGGAFALEVQFPYSDPSADGPVIERACREALCAGFKVSDGFSLVRQITRESAVPVYIMSYAGLVFAAGIGTFVHRAVEAGAAGLIIPDLIPGHDEGLYAACRKAGLVCVPVVVPGIPPERLNDILKEHPEWLYVALRKGITGAYTELGDENRQFLTGLKGKPVRVMAGFGIRQRNQVTALMNNCEAAIVGSALVEVIQTSWTRRPDEETLQNALLAKMAELTGGN